MRLAIEYRQRFNRDIFIDLLCTVSTVITKDEPCFTQPPGKAISKHPNPREIYAKKLLAEGVANEGIVKEMQAEFKAMLEVD